MGDEFLTSVLQILKNMDLDKNTGTFLSSIASITGLFTKHFF